jgi:predicted transcriptional regulator
MRSNRRILGLIFSVTFFVSCGNEPIGNNNKSKDETPKALQDNNFEIKSYNRSGDLTEVLYQELVEKTPALKKLEDNLDAFSSKPNELIYNFNRFDSKSTSYYCSANNLAMEISDSLLRMKIVSLIANSSSQYAAKTANLNSLIEQFNKNGATLNDYHTVLKIVLTIPLIEKYQDDNMLDNKEFKNVAKQQKTLISQTDSLIPKY